MFVCYCPISVLRLNKGRDVVLVILEMFFHIGAVDHKVLVPRGQRVLVKIYKILFFGNLTDQLQVTKGREWDDIRMWSTYRQVTTNLVKQRLSCLERSLLNFCFYEYLFTEQYAMAPDVLIERYCICFCNFLQKYVRVNMFYDARRATQAST